MQEKIFYLALFQKPKQQKKCIWQSSIYYNWQNWFSKIAWSMKFKQFCYNKSCYSHEYLLHSNKSTHFFTHTARHFCCLINIYISTLVKVHTYISQLFTSLMQTFLKDHISHIGTFLYILVCHILLYQWMWNCKLGMYILLDYDLNMLEIGKYTTILKNNTRHLSTNNIISYFRCSTQSLTTPSWPLLCLFVVREFQRNLDFFPLYSIQHY